MLIIVAMCGMMSCECGFGSKFNNSDSEPLVLELLPSPDITGLQEGTIKLIRKAGKVTYGNVFLKFSKGVEQFRSWEEQTLKELKNGTLADFLDVSSDEEIPDTVELKVCASNSTCAADKDVGLRLKVSKLGILNQDDSLPKEQVVVKWKQDKAAFTIKCDPNPCSFYGNKVQEVNLIVSKDSGTITNNAVKFKFEGHENFLLSTQSTGPFQECPSEQPIMSQNSSSISLLPESSSTITFYCLPKNENAVKEHILQISVVNCHDPSIQYAPLTTICKWKKIQP